MYNLEVIKLDNEYINNIKNIKYYRKKLNLTQEQLAEKSDLSVSYIKQIESGKEFKNITFNTCYKLAKALDINIEQLYKNKVEV